MTPAAAEDGAHSPLVLFEVSIASREPTGIPRVARNIGELLPAVAAARGIAAALCSFDERGALRRVAAVPPEATAPPRQDPPFLGAVLEAARRLPIPLALRRTLAARLRWQSAPSVAAAHGPPLRPAPGQRTILLLPHAGDLHLPLRAIDAFLAAGGRLAAICHDVLPLRNVGDFRPHDRVAFRTVLRFVLARAEAVICDSAATRDDLAELAASWRIGLPRLAVVHPPVTVPEPRDRARPEIARMETVPTVLVVGSFVPRKRHDIVLDAVELLRAAGHPVELLAIGRPTPPGRAIFERFLASPGHGRWVRVLTDATDRDVAHAYARASVLASASAAEGFGMPLAEAALFGCPVVCTDLPVFREFAPADTVFVPEASPAAFAQGLARFVGVLPAAPRHPSTGREAARAAVEALCDALLDRCPATVA